MTLCNAARLAGMPLLRAEEETKVREWFAELERPVELLVALKAGSAAGEAGDARPEDRGAYSAPGGVERRFMLEGWAALRVDGRDHEQLEAALTPDPEGQRPRCIVAEVAKR
jgi:hypothetical protein